MKPLRKVAIPAGRNYSVDLQTFPGDGAHEVTLIGIDQETKEALHTLLKDIVGGN